MGVYATEGYSGIIERLGKGYVGVGLGVGL